MTFAAPSFQTHSQTRETPIRSRLPFPVLLYLFAVAVPIGFQVGPLAMTTLRLLLIIVVVPLMIRTLLGHYGRVLASDILFSLFIAWSALALAVNNPSQVIQQVGSVGAEFLGGYAMGRAYIRSRETFLALSRTLIWIILIFLPFAIFETLTARPLIMDLIDRIPRLSSAGPNTMPPRMGLERVQVVFAHAIHWGLFCSVAFSLCFVGLKGTLGTQKRWIYSVLIALSGFLALSSGALLAIVLQFGLIIWAVRSWKPAQVEKPDFRIQRAHQSEVA